MRLVGLKRSMPVLLYRQRGNHCFAFQTVTRAVRRRFDPTTLLLHSSPSVTLTITCFSFREILEILVTVPGWWPSPEIVACSIVTAGFHSWSEGRRRRAVLRYCDEVISDLLATEDSGWDLNTWMCALGRLQLDLTPFLARIADTGPRLVEFYEANSPEIRDGRLLNPFWDEAPEAMQTVIKWLLSPEVTKKINDQYGF
jgi:hypothetical protein